jgi:Fe-S-cluster-containing hydrogenase component 2
MCGECWKICPAGAITPEEKPLCFDYDRCIRCYCCIEVCPFGALDTAETIAGRIIRGAASLILPPGKTR